MMYYDNISSIWTSGRKCNFQNKGCDAGHLQPDNFQGLKAGRLKVRDPSGLTVEGLQEYYDEACLAILNNRYRDGVQWHDMPCYFRSKIICEDSELQMNRIKKEMGVDVSIP